MKKNKLLKRSALVAGTIAAIAAPVATVISCGTTLGPQANIVTGMNLAAAGQTHYMSDEFKNDQIMFMNSSSAGAGYLKRGKGYFGANDIVVGGGMVGHDTLLQGHGSFNFVKTKNIDNKAKDMITYLSDGANYQTYVNKAYNGGYTPAVNGSYTSGASNLKGTTNDFVTKQIGTSGKKSVSAPTGMNAEQFGNDFQAAAEHEAKSIQRGRVASGKDAAKDFYDYMKKRISGYTQSTKLSDNTNYEPADDNNVATNITLTYQVSDSAIADMALIFANGVAGKLGVNLADSDPAIAATNLKTVRAVMPSFNSKTHKLDRNEFDAKLNGKEYHIILKKSGSDIKNMIATKELGDVLIGYPAGAQTIYQQGLGYDLRKDGGVTSTILDKWNQSILQEGYNAVKKGSDTLYSIPVLKSTSAMFTDVKVVNQFISKLTTLDKHLDANGVLVPNAPTAVDMDIPADSSDKHAYDARVLEATAKDFKKLPAPELGKITNVKDGLTEAAIKELSEIAAKAEAKVNGKQLYIYTTDSFQFFDIFTALHTSAAPDTFNGWTMSADNAPVLLDEDKFVNEITSTMDMLYTGLGKRSI